MTTKVNRQVSVTSHFDAKSRRTSILQVIWGKNVYRPITQGLHHTYNEGSNTIHIFTAATKTVNLRLRFLPDTMVWLLEEVYDTNFA